MKTIKKFSIMLAVIMVMSCFASLAISAGYSVTASSDVGYSAARVVKINTSEMTNLNTYTAIDANTTLVSDVTQYKITDAAGVEALYKLANTAKQTFEGVEVYLADNIDVSGKTLNPIGGAFGTVGSDASCFKGTFDGQGFTINNFDRTLTTKSKYSGGLFATLSGGTIKNLVIGSTCDLEYRDNGTSSVDTRVGAIVGEIRGGATVENCYSAANVAGDIYVGGIVGFVSGNGTIKYCTNAGTVTATGRGGGIVGMVTNAVTANIIACNNTGTVICEAAHTVNTAIAVGGICGATNHKTGSTTFSYCVNSGTVVMNATTTDGQIGQICGESRTDTANGGKTIYKYNMAYGTITGTPKVEGKMYGKLYSAAPADTDYTSNRFISTSTSSAEYHGYQSKTNADGSTNIRLVGSIDSLNYRAIGLDIVVIYENNGNTFTKRVEGNCDYVYTSLTRMSDTDATETFSAAELRSDEKDGYLFAVVLENIPATAKNFTVIATPYATANTDGAVAVEGLSAVQAIEIPADTVKKN